MVKLRSEQMRSEEIRSEHGGRSTEIHGCYRRLLLYLFLYLLTNKILFLTQLIILFNLPAKGNSEPIFKVFK